jgi:beta-glucosidase
MAERMWGNWRLIRPLLPAFAAGAAVFFAGEKLAWAYPKGFVWGAGVPSHRTRGEIAAFAQARELGMNTVRVSLDWEKLEPGAGVFRGDEYARYRRWLTELRRLGLRPMVTLHHFTQPAWFVDRGGWHSPDSPRIFLRYVSRTLEELGDLCDLWVTFNEPMILVIHGYLLGSFPPRLTSLDAAFEAAYQIARAHRVAAAMIHDTQGNSPGGRGPDGALRGVGLVSRLDVFDPESPARAKDVEAADAVTELVNWAFIKGITSSRVEFRIPPEVPGAKSFERALPSRDLPPWDVGPTLDWLGVNYFTRQLLRYDADDPYRIVWVPPAESVPVGDDGLAIHPDGLERTLRAAAQRFPFPLVVTANGVADSTDARRADAIRGHLAALDRAVLGSRRGPPLDVRGYYHWSLIDGFEWLRGGALPFGLIDGKPRPSARVYAEEIRKR